MKNVALGIVVALAAGSATAQQPPLSAEPFPVGPEPARPPAPDAAIPTGSVKRTWRAELGASGALLVDSSNSALVGTASADVYLEPLLDLPGPLGLLAFAEHPATVSASLGNTVNGFAASAGVTAYPWDDVGFTVTLGAEDDPSPDAQVLSGGASVQRYFRPNLRGQLGYVGFRLWEASQHASSDGVRASLDWLSGALLLRAQLDVGFQQQEFRGAPLPFDSLSRTGTFSATYYLSRHWSVSLAGSAGLLSANNDPSGGEVITETLAASGQVYLTEALSVTVGLAPAFHQFKGADASSLLPTPSFAQTASSLQAFWVAASYRL